MDDSFESVIDTCMLLIFKSLARTDASPFKFMKGPPLEFLNTSMSLNCIPFEKPLPKTFEHASLQAKLLLR